MEEVDLRTMDKPRPVKVAKELPDDEKKAMVALLTDIRDVFAWSYEDMRGLDPSYINTKFTSAQMPNR